MIAAFGNATSRYGHKMRVVEHWWNQNWGRLFRRDIWLQENDGAWSLRIRIGEREGTFQYRSEADARQQLALLLAEKGPWTQIRS